MPQDRATAEIEFYAEILAHEDILLSTTHNPMTNHDIVTIVHVVDMLGVEFYIEPSGDLIARRNVVLV